MTTPAPSTPAPTAKPAQPTGSFADRVNYAMVYGGLEKHGIHLSDAEKTEFETITRDELKKHDGGQLIGSDFGASAVNLVYVLFAFIQNLFGSATSGGPGGLGSAFGNSVEKTGEQGKLKELNLATIGIYERMKEKGGNLQAAAELVTGQTSAKAFTQDDMPESIFNQVGSTLNIPLSTSTSLDPKPASTEPVPPSGLPSQKTAPQAAPQRNR